MSKELWLVKVNERLCFGKYDGITGKKPLDCNKAGADPDDQGFTWCYAIAEDMEDAFDLAEAALEEESFIDVMFGGRKVTVAKGGSICL